MNVVTENAPTLVLHADDFGMNEAVNSGILRAFREGILTSTSILANAPFASEACIAWSKLIEDFRCGSLPSTERRRRLGDSLNPFDIGVHLNLTQGRPLSGEAYPSCLLDDKGRFPGTGSVFRRLRAEGSRFRDAVHAELRLQIEWIIDHGISLSHMNGHQYVELFPGVAELIPELLQRYSVPVMRIALESRMVKTVMLRGRFLSFGVGLVKRHFALKFRRKMATTSILSPDLFFGTSHAGHIDAATLKRFVSYADRQGCTEIALHPGDVPFGGSTDSADGWNDPLSNDRPSETALLCGEVAVETIAQAGLKLGRLSSLREMACDR